MACDQVNTPSPEPTPLPNAGEEKLVPSLSRSGKWTVAEYGVVPSTNLVAASLGPWHAVRADTQTAGRGRFQRAWISDTGGLWLSAVVPVVLKSETGRMLALAAGLAVCDALRAYGVEHLHMRWPNDILVDGRKLAGLLIDQFVPGRAVIGIGINVTNSPHDQDPSLRGQVERLSNLVKRTPTVTEVMHGVLLSLDHIHSKLELEGPAALLSRINALWRLPIQVRLELDDAVLTGQFLGVDVQGRLGLRDPTGEIKYFEPPQVRLMREMINT